MLMKFKRFLYKQPSWVPKALLGGGAALAVILVVAIAMAVMSPKETPKPNEDATQTVLPVEPTTPAPKPTHEPEVTPEPETEEPDELEEELPYTNPLTGEKMAEDMESNRPYAIMMNNLKKAVPQLGVGEADIIFECPVEGGITRMLAVYQSVDGVGTIGSIRSARDYFVEIASGLDALYLHAGGSPGAYTAIKELGVAGFDCVNGPYEGSLYWRDAQRKATIGLEHSVVTSGDTIMEKFAGYSVRKEHSDGFTSSFNFGEESSTEGAVDVKKMTITYSEYKTGVFDYNEGLDKYMVSEYGSPYVDGNNGEQVGVTNVLVLRTDVDAIPGDTAGRLDVRLTGKGSGLFLVGGTVQEISWSRSGDSAPFQFFTEAGEELVLAVGNTYVNVVDESYDIHLDK